MSVERLRTQLNAQQFEAVIQTEGPLLIFAGAGSGKTRVITFRAAHIVEDLGCDPYRVMCVTFTNKATGEMRTRLSTLLGPERAQRLWISTFHSTGVKLLRRYHERAGLTASFAVYDDGDSRSVVTRVLRELGIDEKMLDVRVALSKIDSFKQEIVAPAEAKSRAQTGHDHAVAQVYQEYEDRLRAANAVDFGDLLTRVVVLLEGHDDVRAALQERFRYLMVDEFQDTNTAQYRIVRALVNANRNLCVVGDDDQAIYGWRGADIRNILDFQKDLPDARVIKLEENYRSTGTILRAANAVISRVPGRSAKTLFTRQGDGVRVDLVDAGSEREEAMTIAARVKRAVRDGTPAEQIAVFYRIHAQSRPLEEALRALDVAYVVVGGVRFYERAEIKDILCYLRLMVNTNDDVSLLRVINQPARGIGKTSLDRLTAHARTRGMPLWKLIAQGDYPDDINNGLRKRMADFYRLVSDLRRNVSTARPSEILSSLVERTGYAEMLKADKSPEGEARLQNVAEFSGTLVSYETEVPEATLGDFLDRVSLSEEEPKPEKGASRKVVSLMTVHGAKGLEFDSVFVTGLEEEMFPYKGTRMGEQDLLDEERRLAYVAITRARKHLTLSFARARMIFGTTRVALPSRFLREIPEELLQQAAPAPSMAMPSLRGGERSGGYGRSNLDQRVVEHDAKQRVVEHDAKHRVVEHDAKHRVVYDEPIEAPAGFRKGMRVRHAQFGVGRIELIEPSGDDVRLTVYFPAVGQKRLMAQFVHPL